MKQFINALKPFKKPLIILGVFLGIFLVFGKIIPTIKDMQVAKTPIKKLQVKNSKIYTQEDKIAVGDFEIKAIHENGKSSTLSSDEVTIDKKTPDSVGKTTEVKVTLKKDKAIFDICKVKNDREKVAEYACGSPIIDDVKAVVYSNGELSFEGKGNVLQYDSGNFPWQENKDTIKSVTFQDEVQPDSMDYWFADFPVLKYIEKLPASVQSTIGMCSGCEILETGVDWTECTSLLDVTSTYEDCPSITSIPKLPQSVRNATAMCRSCDSLQKAPDMTGAKDLIVATSMYENCKLLTETNTPPAVQIMDSMYSGCINMKKAPDINEGVLSMQDTFKDNIAMAKGSRIPASVNNVSGTYSNCPKIGGDLVIDANPEDFSSFLNDSATATHLNLTGKSSILNDLALTNDGMYVRVNGNIAIEEE